MSLGGWKAIFQAIESRLAKLEAGAATDVKAVESRVASAVESEATKVRAELETELAKMREDFAAEIAKLRGEITAAPPVTVLPPAQVSLHSSPGVEETK